MRLLGHIVAHQYLGIMIFYCATHDTQKFGDIRLLLVVLVLGLHGLLLTGA